MISAVALRPRKLSFATSSANSSPRIMEDETIDDKPSKTQRKHAMHDLQKLGTQLTELSDTQLGEIDLPESLREAVRDARRMTKHEARRRQMQFIGRLMREIDPAPVRAKLDYWRGLSVEGVRELHRIERWRERLLEDDDALTEFARAHPRADLQAIRASVREARKGRAAERPMGAATEATHAPRQFRELFQLIKRAIESKPQEGAAE